MVLEKKTKEEIIKLKNDLEKMDLKNFLQYLKDEKRKKFDNQEDIATKVLKEEMRKQNDIKKIINEIEMDIENEKQLKKEEKNDEEPTIDGEINIIKELKNIQEKHNIKYDLVFQFLIKNFLIKKRGLLEKILL